MLNEHTPDAFLEPAYILVSKVWVNQPRVQDLADGKLTLLSGIPPPGTLNRCANRCFEAEIWRKVDLQEQSTPALEC